MTEKSCKMKKELYLNCFFSSRFFFRVWPKQKESDQQISVQVEGSLTTFTQTGLAAGQEYTVTITGEIDGRRGTASSAEFMTREFVLDLIQQTRFCVSLVTQRNSRRQEKIVLNTWMKVFNLFFKKMCWTDPFNVLNILNTFIKRGRYIAVDSND